MTANNTKLIIFQSPVIEPPAKAINGTVSPIVEEANGTSDEKKALLGAEASKKSTKGKLMEKEGMETGKVKKRNFVWTEKPTYQLYEIEQ